MTEGNGSSHAFASQEGDYVSSRPSDLVTLCTVGKVRKQPSDASRNQNDLIYAQGTTTFTVVYFQCPTWVLQQSCREEIVSPDAETRKIEAELLQKFSQGHTVSGDKASQCLHFGRE